MHKLFQRLLDRGVLFTGDRAPLRHWLPVRANPPRKVSGLALSVQPAKHARKPQRDSGRRACTWRGRAAGSPVSGMGNSFGAEHHPTLLARHATRGVVSTQDTCSERYQDHGGRTGAESGVGVSQSRSWKIRKETSHLRAEVGQPRSGCSTGRLKGTDGHSARWERERQTRI